MGFCYNMRRKVMKCNFSLLELLIDCWMKLDCDEVFKTIIL